MTRKIVKQRNQIDTNKGFSRRLFIKGAVGLGFTGLFFPHVCNSARTVKKPNIVIIFLDNIGYGDLACYGNQLMKTSRIDRLASEGARCTDFYIGSPSCMPSRGALLTGRHPLRNGLNEQLYIIDESQQIALPHYEVILPRYLAKAGYVSGCFGKWNLGFAPGSRPTDRGFNEYFGNISGNCDYYTYIYNGRNDLYRNTKPAKANGYSTYVFADAA
jgi:arylsulfatase A-like enzyme